MRKIMNSNKKPAIPKSVQMLSNKNASSTKRLRFRSQNKKLNEPN